MSYIRKKITQKAFALITALAMVCQYMPLSISVFAATDEHPDVVTITVKDTEGNPIEGATVKFKTRNEPDSVYSEEKNKTTDAYGTVEILPANTDFETKTWYVCAEISKEHYGTHNYGTEESPMLIENSTQDIGIVLNSTLITDVTVSAVAGLVYNGNAQNLVSVSGLQKNDKITWTINDTAGDEIIVPEDVNSVTVPTGTDAGTYYVKLKVNRDGMELYESVAVNTTISKAEITGISITGKELVYDGTPQVAVEAAGYVDGDTVTWKIDDEEYTPTEDAPLPVITTLGKHGITLTVYRGENYKVFSETVIAEMFPGNINLENLKVTGLNSVYTVDENNQAVAQEAVTVVDKGDYTLKYQLGNGSLPPDDKLWQDEIPTVTDAGSYTVWVKAVKSSYYDKEVPVEKPDFLEAPYNVFVAKADQTIAFNSKNLNDSVTVDPNGTNTYDFSATKTENLSGKDVKYELVEKTSDEAAVIDGKGLLTVQKAGIVTVKAYVDGSDNYNPVEIYHTVVINVPSANLVRVGSTSIEHTLKATDDVASQVADKTNGDDNGNVTYSLKNSQDNNSLFNIDSSTGAITIKDRDGLFNVMGTDGSATVTVTVSKSEGSLTGKKYENGTFTDITKEVYPKSETEYTVEVKYATGTDYESIITLAPAGDKGWHNKDNHAVITVNEGANYKIALDAPKDFDTTKEITEQGSNIHWVYAWNMDTDEISEGYIESPSVDTISP
ncbi:MAG: cadherin repeat domain-containing protein, partial [Bulleidia sp.]